MATTGKAPAGWRIVMAAVDEAVESGKVKVRLGTTKANLDTRITKAPEAVKGKMKGTLDRLWWNARWQMRKNDDDRYAIFEAIGRMPLVHEDKTGRSYLILTEDEVKAAQAATK